MAAPAVPAVPPGQQEWVTPGTYSFTVPTGVTSICTVCVGGGSGARTVVSGRYASGEGGSLMYTNAVAVTPGETLSVVVGIGSAYNVLGGSSSLKNSAGTVVHCLAKGGRSADTNIGTGGGVGGSGVGVLNYPAGGGGAGGYSGAGGIGGAGGSAPTAGTGGGGGGQGGGGGGGGGVGIYGEGASGAAYGYGGSGGQNGTTTGGGLYGGGGGYNPTVPGGGGAVRILWGYGRSFPSTNTGNM